MKKLILFLLFPLWAAAQTANGTETKANAFRSLSPQTVTSPTFLTTTGTDGTQGKSSNVVNQVNSSNNSGILSFDGLAVNTDPTKYDIGAGVGYVMNSLTGVSTKVTWTAQTAQTTPYLLTSVATYVLKDNAGLTVLQNSAPTPQQYRTHIYLGKLAHTTFTTILFAVTEPSRMFDTTGQVSDINKFLGSGNIEGNVITYNGANLNINASAGMTYRPGANYLNDRNSPSITTETSFTAGTFRNKFRNGSGGWSAVNTTTIDPNYYDDGTGILAVVPNNKWTIKVFWRFGGTGTIHCDYGQTVYDSKAQALEAVGKAVTAEDPETKRDASKRGWLVVKQGITVLNDITTAEFLQADKFGERAAGGSSTATMQTAYNNSVTPQITTSTGLGAVSFKRGSAADTDNVLVVQNGAGSDTFTVKGNGNTGIGTQPVPVEDVGMFSVKTSSSNVARAFQGYVNFTGTYGATAYDARINVTGDTNYDHVKVGQFHFQQDSGSAIAANGMYAASFTGNFSGTGTQPAAALVFIGGVEGTGTVTNKYGIYQYGTDLNRFEGSLQTPSLIAKSGNDGLVVRNYTGAGFGAIYPYSVTPNGSNPSLIASGTKTFLNVDNGGELALSIGTSEKLTIASTGAATFASTISATSYNGGATLTGAPTAPTATAGTNTTQIATTAFVQAQASGGNYTPTLTNTANITSSSLTNATYTRIGDIVTVNIGFSVDPTAANTNTVLTITLPIARTVSNVLNSGSGAIFQSNTRLPASFQTSGNTTQGVIYMYPSSTGTYGGSVTFQYNLN